MGLRQQKAKMGGRKITCGKTISGAMSRFRGRLLPSQRCLRATTAPTSSAKTTTTTTASSFTIHLLWDGHTCSPATKWLGQTSTAEECAKLCHESPKQDTMTRIVWVKNGDKNCKCAADDCTPSEWLWGAVYSLSPTGTATTTTPTPTSTSTGDWILVQADSACRGANPSDNSVAYYVVILAASIEECQRQCSRNPRR